MRFSLHASSFNSEVLRFLNTASNNRIISKSEIAIDSHRPQASFTDKEFYHKLKRGHIRFSISNRSKLRRYIKEESMLRAKV